MGDESGEEGKKAGGRCAKGSTRCVNYDGIGDGGAECVLVWQEGVRCEPTWQWEEGSEGMMKDL